MIGFWILAGLLVAGALLFLLPPLLGRAAPGAPASRQSANLEVLRDQLRELEADLAARTIDPSQYARAREDLGRRVMEEAPLSPKPAMSVAAGRASAAVVALALPTLAVGAYLTLGNPGSLDPAQASQAAGAATHALGPDQIEAMTEGLARRLQEQPGDVDGWKMLARSYGALGRYGDAAAAYGRAAEQSPDDAQLLADYADVLAMAQGRTLAGEPERLIARALQADAKNVKALALAGTAAFHRQDYAGALRHWEPILVLVPGDSPMARSIAGSIEEARALGGQSKPLAENGSR